MEQLRADYGDTPVSIVAGPDIRSQGMGADAERKAEGVSGVDRIAIADGDYDCPREVLLRRYNRGCEGRQALLYLAATHCRGRYSLAELGEKLGPIGLAAVSNARRSMLRKMEDDPELKKRVLALSKRLKKRSIVSN